MALGSQREQSRAPARGGGGARVPAILPQGGHEQGLSQRKPRMRCRVIVAAFDGGNHGHAAMPASEQTARHAGCSGPAGPRKAQGLVAEAKPGDRGLR